MSTGRRVLVAAPQREIRAAAHSCLQGFDVLQSTDEITTSALAIACRPELIILDATISDDPGRVVSALRRDFRTASTPIVHVVDSSAVPQAIGELIAAADDYVVRPFAGDELAARVLVSLRRAAAVRGVSPLTGLPASTAVSEEMARRLATGDPFACLYIDLDDFKAYNDRHGFARGDEVIRASGSCIARALEAQAPTGCFAGHVGGDDFVVLAPIEAAEVVADGITRCFDAAGTGCSMSIGIVTSSEGFSGAEEMAQGAAEMKSVAKQRAGSGWAHRRGSA